MKHSQLRSLALQYARGDLQEDAYIKQRTLLIDDIVAGTVRIDRSGLALESDPIPIPSSPPVQHRVASRSTVVRALLAGLVILILGIAGWLGIKGEDSADASGDRVPTELPAAHNPAPASEARSVQLIEQFLANPDWSSADMERLAAAWRDLSQNELDTAIAHPSMERLRNAIGSAISSSVTTASLRGGHLQRDRRLSELISLADQLNLNALSDLPPMTSGPDLASGSGVELTDAPSSPQVLLLNPTSPANDRAAQNRPARTTMTPNAQENAEPSLTPKDNQLTLQLLASNQRNSAERLVIKYANLGLRVVEVPNSSVPYRVIYGAFDSFAAAESAANSLPGGILTETGAPLVRTYAELR